MARVILLVLTALSLGVPQAAARQAFPEIVPLPDGFRPEGIAVGRGTTFYVGSIPTGAVYRGDLRTGDGAILVPPQDGRASIGLGVDHRNRLFVAGGPTGQAYVYDGTTGDPIAAYQLGTPDESFINDVVVTGDAAWFTDSFNPTLYRLPIGIGGGLPSQAQVQPVPVGGDYVHQPGDFNLNGIDATPNDQTLVVVQSATGLLFTVDPATGMASEIDLGGDTVTAGDGILLDGKTLFVVRNVQDRVAVVRLNPGLASGVLSRHITHPALDVPTTIAKHGAALYAVNARFGVTDPDAHYEAVRLPKS